MNLEMLVLTKTGGLFGPFAYVLGIIMDYIYRFLAMVGIENTAMAIIVFTLVMNLLMLPLTVKQQKTTKLTSVMQPELQRIQAKYKNKKDQASMMKMQAETQAVYDKYGSSMMGGCLPMIVQMLILFSLYYVIRNIPAYVEPVKEIYQNIAAPIANAPNGGAIMQELITNLKLVVSNFDINDSNKIIDALSHITTEQWTTVSSAFSASPDVVSAISTYSPEIIRINSIVGGLNAINPPVNFANGISGVLQPGLIVPILSGVSQWVSTKILMKDQPSMEGNSMGNSMKTMNTIMPIFSIWIALSLPTGLGIYWIANAVFRTLGTVLVNKYFATKDLDEIIAANKEKAAKKAEKRGDGPTKFEKYAAMNTKSVEAPEVKVRSIKDIATASTGVVADKDTTVEGSTSEDSTVNETKTSPKSSNNGGSGNIGSYAHLLDNRKK